MYTVVRCTPHDCQGSNDDEHQLADNLAAIVSPGRELVKIIEGIEPPEFWDPLGGKAEYATGKLLEEVTPSHPARLFHCSNASGRFNVEEVFDFAQEVSLQQLVKLPSDSPVIPPPPPPPPCSNRISLRRM